MRNVSLELAVEKEALVSLYGRDGTGLDNLQQVLKSTPSLNGSFLDARQKKKQMKLIGSLQYQQISGAKVDVKDPTEVEAMVLISGSPEQTHSAMSLILSILADQ